MRLIVFQQIRYIFCVLNKFMTPEINDSDPLVYWANFLLTYGGLHPLDGEEGCEVGGVGADHDQGEEPPQPRYHPGRKCTKIKV